MDHTLQLRLEAVCPDCPACLIAPVEITPGQSKVVGSLLGAAAFSAPDGFVFLNKLLVILLASREQEAPNTIDLLEEVSFRLAVQSLISQDMQPRVASRSSE